MKAMAWLVGLFFGVAVHAAPQPGLMVEYSKDTDDDRVADTYVCGQDPVVWPEGSNVSVLDRGFYAKWAHGQTPCPEVGPWDWWQADYSGLFRINVPNASMSAVYVDFVIDVNDGVRFALFDPDTDVEVCAIDFWQDVPDGWNYQSTDAADITDVCSGDLQVGKLYGFELSTYHQSEMSQSYLHNRAWLDFMVWNLAGLGATVDFLHDPDEPGPDPDSELTVRDIKVKVKQKRDHTFITAKLKLHSTMPVGEDFIRDTLIECIER